MSLKKTLKWPLPRSWRRIVTRTCLSRSFGNRLVCLRFVIMCKALPLLLLLSRHHNCMFCHAKVTKLHVCAAWHLWTGCGAAYACTHLCIQAMYQVKHVTTCLQEWADYESHCELSQNSHDQHASYYENKCLNKQLDQQCYSLTQVLTVISALNRFYLFGRKVLSSYIIAKILHHTCFTVIGLRNKH